MSRASLAQLADKLLLIEEQVRAIRSDLEAEFRPEIFLPRVDEGVLTRWAAELSSRFSLEGESIGALEVQEMSRSEGLEPDELSRSLIQARDGA